MMKYEDYELWTDKHGTITVTKETSTDDGNDCKFIEGFISINKKGELEIIEKYLSDSKWNELLEVYKFISPESPEFAKLMNKNMTAYKSDFYSTRDNTILDLNEYNNEKYYRKNTKFLIFIFLNY